MASIEALNNIVDKHGQEKPEPKPRVARETRPSLMQHAHVQRDDNDVKFTGQRKHQYARGNNQQQSQQKNPAIRTQVQPQHDRSNADAIDGQTQVIRTQVMAQQKQSNLLQQQSGLMQDQVAATQEVSDVMKRLANFMQQQMTKPEPKVQQGNVYEGEFTRVNEKQLAQQERRRAVMEELRERRRERAAKQSRDERGRFQKNPLSPKLQRVGGGNPFGGPGGAGGMPRGVPGGAGGMGALGPLLTLAAMYYGSSALDAMRDSHTFEKKDAGMISRGWQNTKDWVGDKFRSDPGESFLDKATEKSGEKARGELMGANARSGELGSVSAAFESGKRGVGTISTGKGDKGGVSYGKHQLSSKAGTMSSFLRSEDGQAYYNDFRGLAPGSKEFNDKYTEVAKRDGEGFEKAQQKFVKKTHYDPVAQWFSKQYDVDLDQRSRALKEAIYSVSVQYGLGTAKSVLGDAFGNRDITKMDDAELIDRIQETRASTVEDRFKSSSRDTKDGIYKRAGTEKAALLKMLNDERGGPGSANPGSAIGSQYSKQMIGAYGGKSSGAEQTGQPAANGTVGVMAMPQGGGGGGTSGAGDEAGGGTAAEMLSPADGALYALGQKHVKPNDNTVNMAGLNPKFKQAFYTMVGDWVQNNGGTVVNVASAFRTRSEQEKLWVKYGRNTKRVARPGTSRHESGFAIDIDRNSASSLEKSGMFKKYGFHRPLSNEPWHVEMIGAGKGGGGVDKAAANASPQLMQSQASAEMDKAAEATVNKAEENTKGAAATEAKAAGGKPPTDSETGGVGKTAESGAKELIEEEEEEEEVDEKEEGPEDETKEIKKEVVPPTVDLMGNKTPEEQALYEQYLKNAGGDPRGVPDAIANPQGVKSDVTTTPMGPGATPTWSQRNAGKGGNGVPGYGGSTYGQTATGRPAQNPANSQTGRAIKGAVTRIGGIYGLGSFGSMFPGVQKVLGGADSKVNQVLNKNPVVRELLRVPGMPHVPRISTGLPSFGGMVDKVGNTLGGMFGGDEPTTMPAAERPRIMNGQRVTYDGPAVTSTDQIGVSSLNAAAPAMSPASPTYYNNDAPVVTKAAGAPIAPMSAPSQATAMPVAEKVERNSFDGVQKVAISSSDVPMGGGGGEAPASGGGGGAAAGGGKNDMPSIDDVPAIMDDYGLLFINMGCV